MDKPFEFLTIVTTFKRPQQLNAALKSVVAQDGVSKKIVVVDDCPERSAAVVAAQFAEVTYLKNPKPSGGWPGRVRNYGFTQSKAMGLRADYVHFLDDDDTVPPGHYEAVKEAFRQHPGIGVVFGVLRPFCEFSDDPSCRKKQEVQLRDTLKWRRKAARAPWLYEELGSKLGLPRLTRWFFFQHATFGQEMFLCSGGIIREEHVANLGGFPDLKITQDFWFFTAAIRKFGVLFLKKESAGYGVGNAASVWNPLSLNDAQKAAHANAYWQEVKEGQKAIRQEMGAAKYYLLKAIHKPQSIAFNRILIPLLDRRGHFAQLDSITSLRESV